MQSRNPAETTIGPEITVQTQEISLGTIQLRLHVAEERALQALKAHIVLQARENEAATMVLPKLDLKPPCSPPTLPPSWRVNTAMLSTELSCQIPKKMSIEHKNASLKRNLYPWGPTLEQSWT
jgi:hypothetical protein